MRIFCKIMLRWNIFLRTVQLRKKLIYVSIVLIFLKFLSKLNEIVGVK